MTSKALLLICATICSCFMLPSARRMNAGREALITSAIEDVKMEFSVLQEIKLSRSQEKLHAFKKATPETLAQGTANLKFERMVNLAEKKILQNQRQATVQTSSSLAEALATELLHTPGSILTEQEIAKVYQESGCLDTIKTPNCDTPAAKLHRTADGTCNNLANPTQGAAATALRRLIPSRYDDGIRRGRGFLQSQGSPLFSGLFNPPDPSPRIASIGIVQDQEVNDTAHTHMLMQWGQFLDHDVDAVPEYEHCPKGCTISAEFEGSCFPFAIPADDDNVMVTRASFAARKCHEFRRSIGACPSSQVPVTEVRPREQLNSITHYVDGSMVYGSSQDVLDMVRDATSNAGMLRTGAPAKVGSNRPLLPDADSFVVCPARSEPCFLAGDFRVNEQSSLTVMHTLWVREHNRIARFIKDNNPSLTASKVFLVTREIVTSEIQKITFQDYLPMILGDSYSTLIPDYAGYDDTINPSIPNAFASAAFRFGHSQIQPHFARLGENYEPIPAGPLPLVDAFFNTSHVRQFGTDPILRGLVTKKARQVDEYLNSILTSRLFADSATSPGLDLASLNIQRGRDHGLPTYLTWKQWAKERCGLDSDFRSEVTHIRLLQTYGSLPNVDLFVGGLAEKALPGAVVGAVFACIFSKTFVALRDGDRYFYENSNPKTALFSREQRAQLNRASLSRVICDNTDITQIQRNAFLANDASRVSCSRLPSVDLSPWIKQSSQENKCYIKVRSNTQGYYYSVSRRTATPQFRLHFHSQYIPAGGEVCYSVFCPTGSGRTRFAVVANQNPQCAPQSNRNLPNTRATAVLSYFQVLGANAFRQTGNGLYNSLTDCQSSTSVGLVYDCAQRTVGAQQTGSNTNTNTTDIDVDSIEEARRLVSNDEIVNEVAGDTASSTSLSSKEERLVGIMEDMIGELRGRISSSHRESAAAAESHRESAAAVESTEETQADPSMSDESALMSELERALQNRDN